MSDDTEGQPAATRMSKSSVLDTEAQISPEIDGRPGMDARELLDPRRGALLPLFNSETAASRIPVEIWDKILRCLADEPETLGITEEVCQGWYPTSHSLKRRLYGRTLHSTEDVRLYARYIKTIPWSRRFAFNHRLIVEGRTAEQGKHCSIAHFGIFAAMFAGRHLPRLLSLEIRFGEWTPGAIPQGVFLNLSTFHSITSLALCGITLPSITELLHLTNASCQQTMDSFTAS
ncbi:hypothetical protein WOLCODRAFT_156527 [Wolfiporia cocos MD-104 SS10]|uniref:F-box domain-containing protein n=1 Tax=Wolfiporia cocos (strain MD-104) TaxID=742152 RepID=A0A2H3JGJ5_WOLCO|nr:hypothetical protein WOLCODRAFT_156527 [Wolfiporia cocos MD-104 SS10]